jgi:hypothetical protein
MLEQGCKMSMLFEESGIIITGITEQGNKFRPSNWLERLASCFASFQNQKLHYNEMVKPIMHGGKKRLFLANRFSQLNPQGFQFVMDFAVRNHLQVEQVGESAFMEVA